MVKKKKKRPQFNIWIEATKMFGPALGGILERRVAQLGQMSSEHFLVY